MHMRIFTHTVSYPHTQLPLTQLPAYAYMCMYKCMHSTWRVKRGVCLPFRFCLEFLQIPIK